MCKLQADQGRHRFQQASRSVRISGQSTSIRLEGAFWDTLDLIAAKEGLPLSRLVATLYDEAATVHGGAFNFASVLRTVCLLYQCDRADRAIRRQPPG